MSVLLQRGAIHWVQLDKRRPAILISPDRRNQLAGDVVVIPCSTVLRPMSWHVVLAKGEAGLPERSIAKCEQVTALPKELVSRIALGGRLSRARMIEVERALLSALGFLLP